MASPTYELVPVIAASASPTASLRILSLVGVNTKHDAPGTDHGRLYATISGSTGSPTVQLHADVARTRLVASGTGSGLSGVFTLDQQNASGISGRAMVTSFADAESGLVVIPTFCTDVDVYQTLSRCQQLPAYDQVWGLSHRHAHAVREIMTASLPRVCPYLFGGNGLSAFVPNMGNVDIPDLKKLASAQLLAEAQANLVRAMAAEQSNSAEMVESAKRDRARYLDLMMAIGIANTQEPVAATAAKASEVTLSVGRWSRA